MNDKVLVLNAAPKVDKLYTIMGHREGAKDTVLDSGIPGLMMAQELCHEQQQQNGPEYDVWIVEEK